MPVQKPPHTHTYILFLPLQGHQKYPACTVLQKESNSSPLSQSKLRWGLHKWVWRGVRKHPKVNVGGSLLKIWVAYIWKEIMLRNHANGLGGFWMNSYSRSGSLPSCLLIVREKKSLIFWCISSAWQRAGVFFFFFFKRVNWRVPVSF